MKSLSIIYHANNMYEKLENLMNVKIIFIFVQFLGYTLAKFIV